MLRQSEGKAIPFIVKDQSNHYSLTPQAEAFLSQLEAPITIVTVAGLYRTGKSYLLNRILLNRANGFDVGPTVNPCTKGLWLWAQPIRVSEGRTLLVIDTQGLGALDEQSNHDMKIFSLAVLLSTNFIYNSVGSIDQTALQTLSLALHLIGTIDRSNIWNKPNLLWVVRDFSLQLINEHNQSITSSQYLQMALATDHIKQPQKLQLRKIITQSFSQKDCFTLIKPLIDEQRLQTLDRIPVEQLRPQFVSQTITLRKFIMNSLKQMKMNGSGAISGKEYVMMISKYLRAINEGQMPDLADTWTFIRDEKARAAAEQAKQKYNQLLMNRFGPRLPMPAQKLTQMLSTLRKQITEYFIKNCYEQTANTLLIQFIDLRETQVLRLNAKQNKNVWNEILRREFEPYQKKLLSEYYCQLSAYQQDLKQTFTKILPEKYSDRIDIVPLQLELFTDRRIIQAAKIFERKARQETSRTRELKNQSETTLQTELRNLSRTMQDQRKRFQEELLHSQRKMIVLTSEKQRLQQTLQKFKSQELVQTQKSKKKAQLNQNLAQNLQTEIHKMGSVATQQEKIIFSLKKQLEKQRALSTQKQDYMSGKLQQQENKIRQVMSQTEKTLKIWELQKREFISIQQNKQQVLMRQNKQLLDHLQQLNHQLQNEKFNSKKLEEQLTNIKSRHFEEIMSYKEKLMSSNKKEVKRDDDQSVQKLKQSMSLNERIVKENKELEYKCKQLGQQIKITKNNCDKEMAICNQKMEFQQIEINELKIKNNQLNQSYQRYLQHAHQDAQTIEQQYVKKINEINTDYQDRMKYIEQDFERRLKETKRQNNALIEKNSEKQIEISKLKKSWKEKEYQLIETIKKVEKAHQQALNRLSYAQNDQNASIRERQVFYQNKIKQQQSEIETLNERLASEIEEYNRKTESNLTTLKNYYEQERMQWQKRIDDEREKSNKRIKEIQQDWLIRLQDQKEPLENTISQLNQRILAIQQESNKRMQTLRCDYEIRMQKVTNSSIEERMEIKKKLALVQQEAAMVKKSLQNQLEQNYKNYQQSLESVKREITYDYEQQLKNIRQNLQANEKKNQALQRSLRKAEQSNFIVKSQIDKQKAVGKQKVENLIKERRQIQQRYKYDRQMHNRAFEEASNTHMMEQKRLNEDIDKLGDKLRRAQEDKMKIINDFEQQKSSLQAKITYMQGKVKRFKENQDDLLNKFETTVKSLSKNNKSDIEKDFLQRLEKMKEDYNRKMVQKEQAVHQQRKEKDDKLLRLQTQNKSLRDRLLLFEMRQSGKKGREEDHADEIDRIKEMYQKRLHEMRQELQRYAKQLKYIKEERDHLENTVRMQKSRMPQRHSFINQNQNMDTSYNKSLRQNKSLLNSRPNNPTQTQPKKQYNRVMNMQDVTGIMKWQHQ